MLEKPPLPKVPQLMAARVSGMDEANGRWWERWWTPLRTNLSGFLSWILDTNTKNRVDVWRRRQHTVLCEDERCSRADNLTLRRMDEVIIYIKKKKGNANEVSHQNIMSSGLRTKLRDWLKPQLKEAVVRFILPLCNRLASKIEMSGKSHRRLRFFVQPRAHFHNTKAVSRIHF